MPGLIDLLNQAYQQDRKKKRREEQTRIGTAISDTQRTPLKERSKEFRSGVDLFYQMAKRAGFRPEDFGHILAAGVPEQEQFDFQYDRWLRNARQTYGADFSVTDSPEAMGMMVDSWRTKGKMEHWRQDWSFQFGPETITAAVGLPELASLATSKIFNDLFTVYGDDATAMALQTALIDDPDQRAQTWAMIEDIAQKDMPLSPYQTSSGGYTGARIGAGAQLTLSEDQIQSLSNPLSNEELLTQVLADPGKFATLAPNDQIQVIQYARDSVSAQDQLESSVAGQVVTARNVLMKQGGVKIVLDKRERELLKTFESQLPRDSSGNLKNESVANEEVDVGDRLPGLGITDYAERGGQRVYVFDPDWVKQNFAKYTGIVRLLKTEHPDAIFEYGSNGIVGQVGDLWNQSTDVVSAKFGALANQINEAGENAIYSNEDRAMYQANADRIRKLIETGKIPPEQMGQAVAAMLESEDVGSADFGFNELGADVRKYQEPAVFGTGFGDSMTTNLEIYPGDPAYDNAHAALSLVGQLVFDPTIVLGKVVKAVKLARLIPEGAVVGKSALTQLLFDSLAKSPEELLASTRGRALSSILSEGAAHFDDAESFATHVFNALPMDMPQARALAIAAKESPEALHAELLHSIMGKGARPLLEAKLVAKVDDASEALRLVDESLPAEIRSLRAQIGARTKAVARAESATRPVGLVGQRINRTGQVIGDLERSDYVWVKTEDLLNNLDTRLQRAGTDVPQAGYETSLQEEIAANGHPKPIEVTYDRETGRFELTDGNHDFDAALALGDEYVPVRTVDTAPPGTPLQQAVNYVPQTTTPITELAPDRFRGLASEAEAERVALADRLHEVEADYRQRLTTRDDVFAEKSYWQNVLKGSDFDPVVGLRTMPTRTSIRKLRFASTAYGRAFEDATQLERALPLRVYDRMTVAQLEKFIRSNPVVDKLAGRLMESMRRWGHDTGTGQKVFFETSTLPEGELADEAVRQGYDHVRDFGRFLGAPDEVIDRMVTNMSRAAARHSRPEMYEAFVNGYQEMVDSARRLTATGKSALKDMWPELVGERSAGYVKTGKGARVKSTPTLWVPRADEAGDITKSGVPIIEADMLNEFALPTFEQVRDHVSVARSYMQSWREAGLVKRNVAGTYLNLANGWRGFNSAWARVALLGRMPTALPLRIQTEQQVRIAAFGYSSLVKHPVEWFKSIIAKEGDEGVRIFFESPTAALGTMVKDAFDNPSMKLARRGRQTVNLAQDGEAAVRALAGRVKAYAASPSTRVFLGAGTDKAVVETIMADSRLRNTFVELWDNIIAEHKALGGPLTSYDKIVHSIRTEMKQVIGSGTAAERIRGAALTGKMSVSDVKGKLSIIDRKVRDAKTGRIVTEDADLIADEMNKLYAAGEWKPDVFEFPRQWGDYLPPDKQTITTWLKRKSDQMFNTFYARPDIYFGRSPLFRQVAAREYDRLLKLGYGKDGAKAAAEAFGARKTADILFTIGANSSADHYVRAFMPFFPAWKELATTWLGKIPAEIGGGGVSGWLVGAPALARRVDAWVGFFTDTGIAYKDGDQWRVKIPFLAPLVRTFTGLDVDSVSFSADSVTSLLPVPSLGEDDPFYKGLLPTLGAPAGVVLNQLNQKFGGEGSVFDDLETSLTLFGGDQSLGPAAVDNTLEAFGITPPWMSGQSREMADMRRNWAFIDALRIKYSEMYDSKPVQKDYKSEEKYLQANAQWLETLYDEAERSSRNWYLMRSISSTILPFSIKYTDNASTELTGIWNVISGMPTANDKADFTTPMLESLRDTHPELELYLTGKTIQLTPDDPDRVDDFESFKAEIEEGKRLALEPKEWLVWALGSQEAALHRSRLNEIFDRFTKSPQQWLLSGYDSSQELVDEQNRWDTYLRSSERLGEIMDVRNSSGEPTNFASMYESFYEAKVNRYDDQKNVSLTLEQEKATEAIQALNSLSRFFGAEQYTDDSYLEVRRTLNEIADRDYKSKDPVFKATGWWWEHVRPYFDEKNEVWSKIDETPASERAPLYRQLVDIENKWAGKTIRNSKWGVMPQPQEVMFNKLSPEARRLKLFDWARLPVEFLSTYQRQKVYGSSPKDKKIDKLAGIVNENERQLELVVDRGAISTSSTDYERLRRMTDRKNADAAKQLGVVDVYQQWQLPPYKRAGSIVQNPYWDKVVSMADVGRRYLEGLKDPISPRGSSPAAVEYQRRLVGMVEKFRREDPQFNHIMHLFEIAYGEGADKPAVGIDTYWPLFFEGFGTAPGYLNYYHS